VQVPDPFLKNILFRATEAVFAESRKRGVVLGFKDMGAGGIMCSTSELCDAGGYGGEIDIDKIHISMKNLPPYVIACGETQERFTWISPPEFTPTILKIYNDDFELPSVAEGACAKVIGKVTKSTDYIMRYEGKVVCNVPVNVLTQGIRYQRERKELKRDFKEPILAEPRDYNAACLSVLSHPNVASKAKIYKHYDTEVQGLAVIRPGEADAGMQAPIPGCDAGVALTVDHNPRYSRINPYLGGVNAVYEAMRNIASVGATPYGMTDCLNFGNPEVPEVFNDFVESVKGIADAANKISLKVDGKSAVPFVSGNVSFYNQSVSGKQVDPSPIISCVGFIEDYRKAVTMKLKEVGSELLLVGMRKDELGGSVYYELNNELGVNVPMVDFDKAKNQIYAVIDSIDDGAVLSCHDISDGGLLACISEMVLGGEADGMIGADINIDSELRADKMLFSETPGFIIEAKADKVERLRNFFRKYNTNIVRIGNTTNDKRLAIKLNKTQVVNLAIDDLKKAWTNGVVEALS